MIDNSFRNKSLKEPDEKLLEFLPEMIDIIELATFLISNKMSIKWKKYQLGVVDIYFISSKIILTPFFDRLKTLLEKRYPIYIVLCTEKGNIKFEVYVKEYIAW